MPGSHSPLLSQTFLLQTLRHTPLVQELLSFILTYLRRGKQFSWSAAQMVAEDPGPSGGGGRTAHTTVPAIFTQLLTALLGEEGQGHMGPRTLISLQGFIAVSRGVGGHHILCHPKEMKYRKPQRLGVLSQKSQEKSSRPWHTQTWVWRPNRWGVQLQQGAPARTDAGLL